MCEVTCETCGNVYIQTKHAIVCHKCHARPKVQISKAATESRAKSRLIGAKSLTGTAKQKNWAEKIRADFIEVVTSDDVATMIANSQVASTAKFWIETRNLPRNVLHEAMRNLVAATREANEIGAGNDGYEERIEIRNAAIKTLGL